MKTTATTETATTETAATETGTAPLALRPHVTATPTADDGMVLLDQRTGTYWQMNATATAVLHALLDGATAGQAATRLAAAHPAAADRAEDDVAALVRHLREAGLTAKPRRRGLGRRLESGLGNRLGSGRGNSRRENGR